MENTIYPIEALFNISIFHIPQYQRAYSWVQDPHLEAFLEDLRQQIQALKQSPDKRYFLGTLLLHHKEDLENCEHLYIVDGQQRLTTLVVFIASALELAKTGKISLESKTLKLLRRAFIQDDDAECQKFHTIKEDEPFFQSAIIQTSAADPNCNYSTPSSKRLNEARVYFQASVKPEEWPSLLEVLRNSRVMVYSVNNSADATQIFELQNDRGKRLTDLEALKSFLMHSIYLNAANPDDKLAAIQSNFSHIFRIIEELDSIKGAPEEDAILSYFCVAFADWKNDEWRNPKKLAKDKIFELSRKGSKFEVIAWIEKFVGGLVSAFGDFKLILNNRDKLFAFSDLYILGRLYPFWPLILKTWHYDQTLGNKQCFEVACRLMEIYAFRGYGISNMRSDGGQTTLYAKARDFIGDFPILIEELKIMCGRYNVDKRFLDGLGNPNIYNTDKGDARYLLWKYENHLRLQTGQKQPLLSWRDYLEPKDDASRFSIEHITAQDDPIVKRDVEWVQGEPNIPFGEIALHRLGNLVLDSSSPNSAKGAGSFSNKLLYFQQKSIYLSQKELLTFTNEKDINGNPIWGIKAIQKREQVLIEFAKKEWDYNKINCPPQCNQPT